MNSLIPELWHGLGHLRTTQRDFLIGLMERIKPKYCLETGFATGRSCVSVYFTAYPTKMVSIELNLDQFHGARDHSKKILEKAENLVILEMDSTKINFQDIKTTYFDNNNIDFAFIDGDHSYSGCSADLYGCYEISNPGTIIVVDDYESGPPDGIAIHTVTHAVNDFVKDKKLPITKWNVNGKGFAIITV